MLQRRTLQAIINGQRRYVSQTPSRSTISTSEIVGETVTLEGANQMKEARIGAVKTSGQSRRFYKKVGITPLETGGGTQYMVTLDSRIVKTPMSKRLLLPTKQLASLVAFEWDCQQTQIIPSSMPMMTLSTTATDVLPEKKNMIIDNILNHVQTDIICIRIPESPEQVGLPERQAELYDPLNHWFSEFMKTKGLQLNTGIWMQKQDEDLMRKIQWNLFAWDDHTLSALDSLVTSLRSFVLALALWQKHIDVDFAIMAVNVEEDYRLSEDLIVPGYHDIRDANLRASIDAALLYLHLIPPAQLIH
ncbi:putative ATP synthase mitochondrial F1 complex assembly factor 2, mitochondrial precursor [Planoprotostelium fungivorum]|uniref:Putative ATP synthase mitochondrial F1 complex assembly factor 2, mitochondrial n=1 Tax=Planoprotostelium fungivorum TaxID=1890364 RepID=A0A2P6NYB4_9EUKA|nr:putative ATP synthase mitochondrial F1 complex assembly factor 2, mitochondrial precursor [Planoprotostelium fungivorum]